MARWRLTAAHYLAVEGTKYIYEETSRDTGEINRQEFAVPRLLDPEDPRAARSHGDCIVSRREGAQRGDWIYDGPPTPDMEPLDAEAEAITEEYRANWINPIDELPDGESYAEALLRGLEQKLTAALAGSGRVIEPSGAGVSPEDFKALQEQVAALMARNAELEAGKGRRV